MRPDDVRELLRRQPFHLFKLTLTDGMTYEIRHPDLAMVGRSTIAIGMPVPNDPDPVYDRLVTVSLLHVMQIESVEKAAPPST